MMSSKIGQDLQRFLRYPLTRDQAKAEIARRLQQREHSFLRLVKRAIYGNPRSPYKMLLQHAGIAFPDLSQWIVRDGLEATLGRLYDAGVYVSTEEFKGRRPIFRSGLELRTNPRDFDNPLITGHFEGRSGGSTGSAIAVPLDLRMLMHDAAFVCSFLDGFGLHGLPIACWRGVPPITSGIRSILMYAKVGVSVERWFAQNKPSELPEAGASTEFTRQVLDGALSLGWSLPEPEYVHPDDSVLIARWLADRRAAGQPAQLDTNSSSGVRVCLAALDHGLDISGSYFRLGGEPYTEAKAMVIRRAGCRAGCHYTTTEALRVGVACSAPEHLDEVHLLIGKFAFLCRAAPAVGSKETALVLTTLLPSAPKIMLNVESGDWGEIERRDCGCPIGDMGLDLHAWNIRSYEKITSEALSFLCGDLIPLVEQILPDCFGGDPSDYQLVEMEEKGMPFVEIIVSPRVGAIEPTAVTRIVYDWLRARPGEQFMADFWEDADTLRVARRTPYATGPGKILPLHRLMGRTAQP